MPTTERPDTKLPIYIDNTMLTSFRGCPRKFFYEYLECLRLGGRNIHLHAGACFAHIMESTYLAYHGPAKGDMTEAYRIAYPSYLEAWGDFPDAAPDAKPSERAKSRERIWEAAIDYFDTYPIRTDPIKPLSRDVDGHTGFEFSFAEPLDPDEGFPVHPETGEPFIYCGRFDTFGQFKGKPIIRDEKTTGSSFSRDWPEQWSVRNQFMGYVWGAQRAGFDVNTVCIRGVAILLTKFHQAQIFRTYDPFMIERWYEQLKRDMWRLVRCYEQGYFDYNFGDHCTSYGNCEYMALCSSPHPQRWYSDFVRGRWNPTVRDIDLFPKVSGTLNPEMLTEATI